MAYPDDIGGLYAWWRADSFTGLGDGDPCGNWTDKSGNGRTMVPAGTTPTWYGDQIAGQPAVLLPGSGSFEASAAHWFDDLANHTLFLVFKTDALASGGALTSLGGSASECICHRDSSGGKIAGRYKTSVYADAVCNIDEWHFAIKRQTATSQISIGLDGGAEVITTGIGARGVVGTLGNVARLGVDGGAYYHGRVAEAGIFNLSLSDSNLRNLVDYLRARYFAVTPEQIENVRDVLSRRLWLWRRPPGILRVKAPLWMLDADILERVAIETRYGPAPGALGWGTRTWRRRAFSIQRMEVNLSEHTVELELLDRRPLDVLLYSNNTTDEAALILNATRQSGVARLTPGNVWTFVRGTRTWVLNPADSSSVIEIQQNERAITSVGEYIEEARRNQIPRSSFLSGSTGLGLSGTGTNGSAIDLDYDELLFNPEMGAPSLRFTAGDPHTAILRASFPPTDNLASVNVRVSIDHKTDSGEPLSWTLQRTSGAPLFFWDDSTGGWVSSLPSGNPLPTQSTRSPAGRFVSKAIPVGLSTPLTLGLGFNTGGTAGRISHVYHVQIEVGNCATSRVVSDMAANGFQRVMAKLQIDVPNDLRCYEPGLGSFFCEVLPEWSSADLGSSEDRVVYEMTTNGGADYDRLYYDASAGAWTFERKVGATTYTATKTATVTAGTPVKLGARWTGPEGELELDPYTISVFVDGEKGSDAVAAASTFDAGGETLFLGQDSSYSGHFNGALRELRIFPYALEDVELARLP